MIYLTIVWLLSGICGYFMMRRGFLVAFENSLGKRGAWGFGEMSLGILCIFFGVLNIFLALIICGLDCFRKIPPSVPLQAQAPESPVEA